MLQSDVILLPSPGPDAPAIIVPPAPGTACDALRISYRRLGTLVGRAQESLAQLGIAAGSRVAVALPNGAEFVVVFLALVRQRAVVAPLNPDAKLNEQAQMLARIQPACTIVPDDPRQSPAAEEASAAQHVPVATCAWDEAAQRVLLRRAVQQGPCAAAAGEVAGVGAGVGAPDEVRPDDVVLLHYTSGTTGLPKAVGLTHAVILASVRILTEAHALRPTDRTLIVAPFFHVGGTCSSLLCALAAGGCAIIPRSLSGAVWHQFKEFGATWYHAVPTMHRLLLSFPRPTEGVPIRFVRSGGSSISGELIAQLERTLGCPVLEGYGMTETVQADFCNRLGSDGRLPGHYPVPEGVEVRVRIPDADGDQSFRLTDSPGCTGEVCIRGPCVISGYLNDPGANREAFHDGFFRTGDLGTLHADGRLQVTGRLKEMINKGGEKISPLDIEHIILAHEAIHQVACFKVPDETYGEDIGVAVIVKPGYHLSPLDVKRFVRQQSVHFKVPKMVTFVDSIPTNRSGKYVRALLAERFGSVAA
ncbi:putative peroxisomal-coenzyme A synthetase [Tolypocladium ophioglossoides CBS 100239]|uniref:Putative peroxisomal-coenzyme A synthetase n=1 Tax=Tolypocladium ophioglossoides (strain CBS 100239) TaxID=1163406 RepID=A0A0L0NE12_TOLOC|nr:putative peroxisomal-coenzyme A synthetase [Tolypocladium ophioglossoides CBS 100239]